MIYTRRSCNPGVRVPVNEFGGVRDAFHHLVIVQLVVVEKDDLITVLRWNRSTLQIALSNELLHGVVDGIWPISRQRKLREELVVCIYDEVREEIEQ